MRCTAASFGSSVKVWSALLAAACSSDKHATDAPPDATLACADLRMQWQSITSGLSTSCVSAAADCLLVGYAFYSCDGLYASISGSCGGTPVNRNAYRSSGAPALEEQWNASECPQSATGKFADCARAMLSCDQGSCRAQPRSCLFLPDPPMDRGQVD